MECPGKAWSRARTKSGGLWISDDVEKQDKSHQRHSASFTLYHRNSYSTRFGRTVIVSPYGRPIKAKRALQRQPESHSSPSALLRIARGNRGQPVSSWPGARFVEGRGAIYQSATRELGLKLKIPEDISATEDAEQMAILDHRYLPDIPGPESVQCFVSIRLRAYHLQPVCWRHNLADRSSIPLIAGQPANIVEADEPNYAVALEHRKASFVGIHHLIVNQVSDGNVGRHGWNIGAHQPGYRHSLQEVMDQNLAIARGGGSVKKPTNECEPESSGKTRPEQWDFHSECH